MILEENCPDATQPAFHQTSGFRGQERTLLAPHSQGQSPEQQAILGFVCMVSLQKPGKREAAPLGLRDLGNRASPSLPTHQRRSQHLAILKACLQTLPDYTFRKCRCEYRKIVITFHFVNEKNKTQKEYLAFARSKN